MAELKPSKSTALDVVYVKLVIVQLGGSVTMTGAQYVVEMLSLVAGVGVQPLSSISLATNVQTEAFGPKNRSVTVTVMDANRSIPPPTSTVVCVILMLLDVGETEPVGMTVHVVGNTLPPLR